MSTPFCFLILLAGRGDVSISALILSCTTINSVFIQCEAPPRDTRLLLSSGSSGDPGEPQRCPGHPMQCSVGCFCGAGVLHSLKSEPGPSATPPWEAPHHRGLLTALLEEPFAPEQPQIAERSLDRYINWHCLILFRFQHRSTFSIYSSAQQLFSLISHLLEASQDNVLSTKLNQRPH